LKRTKKWLDLALQSGQGWAGGQENGEALGGGTLAFLLNPETVQEWCVLGVFEEMTN